MSGAGITTYAEAWVALCAIAEERADSICLDLEAWFRPSARQSITNERTGETQAFNAEAQTHSVKVSVWSSRDAASYAAPTYALAVRCYRERERNWETLVERDRGEALIEGAGELPAGGAA